MNEEKLIERLNKIEESISNVDHLRMASSSFLKSVVNRFEEIESKVNNLENLDDYQQTLLALNLSVDKVSKRLVEIESFLGDSSKNGDVINRLEQFFIVVDMYKKEVVDLKKVCDSINERYDKIRDCFCDSDSEDYWNEDY